MALIAVGDHDRAVGHLRLAVQIQPEAAEAHYRLAGLLRRKGQIDAAIATYRQTIECDPNHIRARRDLAALLLSQRRPQEALDQLRWIVDRGDANADVHNLAGVAWKLIGDLDEAVASYRRALAINPDYHLAHNNIANVLAAQGRSDEAVAHYRRALEIKPDYTQAREGLNDLLRAQGSSDGPGQVEEIPQ
jgi:tetratricopeptide (TPR) repeat protein